MSVQSVRNMVLAGAALALAACGGGGGGDGVAFVAPPPPPPGCQTAPCQIVQPPPPTKNIGLHSDAPFDTFSVFNDASGNLVTQQGGVQIAYSAADDQYTVTLPGFEQGKLVTTAANGSFNAQGWTSISSTVNDLTAGNSSDVQPVKVVLDYPASSDLQYTSFGEWREGDYVLTGQFVYGIPTAAGDVPVTGMASYAGDIRGRTSDQSDVFGTIDFQFDFAAGTLTGQMTPEIVIWDLVPLGTYTFRDTVYSSGSTTFSGAFNVPGSTAPSSFDGRFTGPGAAELMGNWIAPYTNPGTTNVGTMSGIFAGKRKP